MVLNYVEPKPMTDLDSSPVSSAAQTPTETVAADLLLDDLDPLGGGGGSSSAASVPWPGSTFIIRSISDGQVLTLLDGQIVLARPGGGRGSIHWACVESKGWLGFQNPVSGKFLGYNKHGTLGCSATRHQEWENFCVRAKPNGGYILLMTHWERLWQIGVKNLEGVERVVKVENGELDGTVWEFVKV
jgi:hypothetical protein